MRTLAASFSRCQSQEKSDSENKEGWALGNKGKKAHCGRAAAHACLRIVNQQSRVAGVVRNGRWIGGAVNALVLQRLLPVSR